jgi:NAD(P)-dependent dehydrogenase (short-subunit alcohol dehydrogenase family)
MSLLLSYRVKTTIAWILILEAGYANFLTGASGFIGSRILSELLAAGHQVTGLARSEASALALQTAGAEVQYGTLEDPDSLLAAVARCDAVIHTAFDHDFSRFVENCEKDHRVILAIGAALQGSRRPLIITSGTAMGDIGNGLPASEMHFNPAHPNPRVASERAGNRLLDAGVDVRVVRLPQVHDTTRQGLLTYYIAQAAEKGVVAVVGEGITAGRPPTSAMLPRCICGCWNKVWPAGAIMPLMKRRSSLRIAEVVAEKLHLPLQSLSADRAAAHFGWFAAFAGMDLRHLRLDPPAAELAAHRPGLLDDLRRLNHDK